MFEVFINNNAFSCAKEHVSRLYLNYLFGGFTVLVFLCVLGKPLGWFTTDQVIRIAGSGVTFLAIFFAGFQFKANHDWNRRHAAILAAKEVRSSVSEDIDLIDKTFGFSNRRKHEKLTVEDIHKKMCEIDDDGKFVRGDDGKLKLDHESGGVHVARAIKNYLGAFEYLSAGIRQGVLDEEIIYTLYGGPIIRAASIFQDYIRHVNDDMYPGRNGKIYENLVCMCEKFKTREEDRPKQERPSPG